jgi:recombinational DNA repair protein RecT
MANQLQIINETLNSESTTKELAVALGISTNDEAGIERAKKYAYGVFATIQASVGTKQDLSDCNPNSIKATMIEAANRGVYIDGRQHAHLVKYGNNCTFQMGFRGYLAKIKEYYPDADFVVEAVYKGDTIKIWNENGFMNYKHEKAGAFRSGEQDFLGILFAITYTDNGRLIQKVMDVPKERIDRAKSAAKQQYIWNTDYIEKAKAAAIKNACKHLFASIQGLQDIVDYENNNNYDPNQPATPVRKSIVDNINESAVNKPQNIQEEKPQETQIEESEPEFIEGELVDEENYIHEGHAEALIIKGGEAAKKGYEFYGYWVATLTDEQKDIVRDNHKSWTDIARNVSRKMKEESQGADSSAPI